VAYLTRALRLDLGVVISASHNPFADNGIKFFSAAAKSCPTSGSWPSRPRWSEPPQWADSAAWARPAARGRRRPLHRVLQEHGAAHLSLRA
jgi:phosphoglucosamine mutase